MNDLLLQLSHVLVIDLFTDHLIEACFFRIFSAHGLHGMIILDGLYFGDDVLIDRSGYLCAVLPVYFVAVVLRRVVACSHYDTCGTSQRTKGKGQFRGRS